MLESTDSEGWARASDVLVALAYILLIGRGSGGQPPPPPRDPPVHGADRQPRGTGAIQRLRRQCPDALQSHGPESLRPAARATTPSHPLRSATTVVVWIIAGVMIPRAAALGLLIAGAGIAGAALGFGKQSLVGRLHLGDLHADRGPACGVGDIITCEASGTVEAVSLRTTSAAATNGTVWHIPNGNIPDRQHVAAVARALLDVSLATDTDVDHAQDVIKRYSGQRLERLRLAPRDPRGARGVGVERLGPDVIVIRLVVKTCRPSSSRVMREAALPVAGGACRRGRRAARSRARSGRAQGGHVAGVRATPE